MSRRRDDDDLVGDEGGRGGDGRRLGKGDNGAEAPGGAELRQFIERIERLEEEKATISDDIKDVYGELKGRGYDSKAVRTIVKIRKQDRNERMEQESILNTYLGALGMPLLGDD